MFKALPYTIIAGLLAFMGLFYFANYQHGFMDEVLIKVDVFGLTKVAEQEQDRLARIQDLTIPYEEKQVLTHKTIFMGASMEMVELALGKPNKIAERYWQEQNAQLTYYVYFLPNDKRPTVLVFEAGKCADSFRENAGDIRCLFDAYKGSAFDYNGAK